jgi:general secretion pathway protein D
MLARSELAAIARRLREGFSRRPDGRRLARTRRGVARRSLLQWGALASVAFGSLAVAAWTQDLGARSGARDSGAHPAAHAENRAESRSAVRLAQDVEKTSAGQPAASPESRAPSPAPRAPSPLVTRRAELKNISATDFESALEALSLRNVGIAELPEGDVATYETSAEPDSVRIYIARNSGKLSLQGPADKLDAWQKLIETVDIRITDGRSTMKVLSLDHAEPADVRKAISILNAATSPRGQVTSPSGASRRSVEIAARDGRRAASLISTLLQPGPATTRNEQPQPPAAVEAQPAPRADVDPRVNPNAAQPQPGDQRQPTDQAPTDAAAGEGLIGPVRIEYNEALDKLIIIASDHDMPIVLEMIRKLDQEAALTRPVIEVYELQHVENQALSLFISTIYTQVLEARQGSVSITPLIKPNALLIVGRRENVDSVIELIKKFDQPVNVEAEFETFQLKHTSAFLVQRALREFYGDLVTFNQYVRTALGTKAHVVVDYRTNKLFVQARARDMVEVQRFIEEMDVAEAEGNVNQIRTVKLQNSLAQELAPIIQQAITGPQYPPPRQVGGGQGQQQQLQQQQPGQGGGQGTQQLQEAQTLQARSVMLQLLAQDANGQRLITSDILTDVRITAEPRGNALIVSAPEGCMELILTLIEQIDQLPPAEAQIKVFSVVNADAQTLAATLQTLFGQATGGGQQGGNQFPGGGANQQNFRIASADDEGGVLIPLRIAVEQRTNSIIVTGSAGDLAIVQALLVRLDDPDARERQTRVHRLQNAPAQNISDAINLYLQNQRTLQQQLGATLVGTVEQFEREVIVVPEPVSNALIVSATPRYFKEITELVQKLDERPPMVMIQVLIAEVVMRDVDEFGVEIGVQDSILFDRSLAGLPGFAFNNAPLGNNTAVGGSDTVGSQSLSSFGVGRTNADLGFGGLVMSASSESISVLLRALQENRRLDVLSRPQVMTLDNQPAFIQVGQQVPYITGINPSNVSGTTSFSTDLIDVGIILTVIPRISPDGMVVMEIDATKSAVGPDEEGIPISIAANGDVIRSPRIDTQRAQTTVMAASGQTVILGGLITKRLSRVHRQVPWIGDLPYVGRLFSFDSEQDERTELMVIMTPHVVRRESDNDLIKQVEGSRMSWCMADVYRIHGPGGPRGLGLGNGDEVPVFYPDENPVAPEGIPAPETPAPSVLNGGPTSSGPTNGGNFIAPPVDVQPSPVQPGVVPPPDPIDQLRPLPIPADPLPQDRLPAVPMTRRRIDEDRRDEMQGEPRYESRYAEPRDARYETRYDEPRNPAPNQVQPANFNTYEAQRDAYGDHRLP